MLTWPSDTCTVRSLDEYNSSILDELRCSSCWNVVCSANGTALHSVGMCPQCIIKSVDGFSMCSVQAAPQMMLWCLLLLIQLVCCAHAYVLGFGMMGKDARSIPAQFNGLLRTCAAVWNIMKEHFSDKHCSTKHCCIFANIIISCTTAIYVCNPYEYLIK